MPADLRVREAMDQLAATLNRSSDVTEALGVITAGAVEAVPGADHASISVRHQDGRLETFAATAPFIDDIDAHQYETHEGPCYETVTDEPFIVSYDIAADPRWPRYGPFAADHGVRAQLAALLTTNGFAERSALNVYAAQPHEFDQSSVETAQLFASHAAVALGFVRTIEHLGKAVTSHQLIGQAVGIVMERYQLDPTRAFEFLVRLSNQSNVKINAIAADIVDEVGRRDPGASS